MEADAETGHKRVAALVHERHQSEDAPHHQQFPAQRDDEEQLYTSII